MEAALMPDERTTFVSPKTQRGKEDNSQSVAR